MPGRNDLASSFPDVASEWDFDRNFPLSHKEVSFGSHKKVFWLCQLQHSYESDVGGRTRGRGCPYCSGNAVLAGFNDLAITRPEMLAEWDYDRNLPLTPRVFLPVTTKNFTGLHTRAFAASCGPQSPRKIMSCLLWKSFARGI